MSQNRAAAVADTPASMCRRKRETACEAFRQHVDEDHQTLCDTPASATASGPSEAESAHSSAARRLSSSTLRGRYYAGACRPAPLVLLERFAARQAPHARDGAASPPSPRFGEPLQRIGARRFQHPIARDGIALSQHQRLVHERAEMIERRPLDPMRSSLATCWAASSVKPPAKTPSRRNTVRSSGVRSAWLHSSVARNV